MLVQLRGFLGFCGLLLWVALLASSARAQAVLTFEYTPTARAQVAIWIEDAKGRYLTTAVLSDSVAFRGIGNRPGASEMNSGYRWPYGRREGVLPIWAHRRAAAPGAKQFPRVIFQDRVEGFASQTKSDQSLDSYYCLQFDAEKARRDNLDAVSCATPFHSDKGRYMTEADLAAGYFEPWEEASGSGAGAGKRQALPLTSLYPARMDVEHCRDEDGACFDHADLNRFAADVRAVMPEIDAIAMATPSGNSPQSVLFSVPRSWSAGEYVAFIEVNVEGDYNERWNETSFPTPHNPDGDWDYYALNYGYSYRGQPSLVWRVAFTLGDNPSASFATDLPAGRASWDYWAGDYGMMQSVSFGAPDTSYVSMTAANSGVNRLRANAMGQRFSLRTKGTTPKVGTPEPEPVVDAGTPTQPIAMTDAGSDAGVGDAGGEEPASDAGSSAATPTGSDASSASNMASNPEAPNNADVDAVGPVLDLELGRVANPLRTHTWARLQLRAARSLLPLHDYEVRVATEPIVDAATFIRAGRQARSATDSAEGATLLSLPTDVPAGEPIVAGIGDLVAETHYYVGVRATDELNRHGPISVAEITTTAREFATVSPCFIASAAYGSPLAAQVGVLRRVRDRYLLSNLFGRAFVSGYYAIGAPAAGWLAPRPSARALVRGLLAPLVRLSDWLD